MFVKEVNIRGQVTIFIIIAVLIVAGVAGYFLLRDKIVAQQIPETLEPIYLSFLLCLEDSTYNGIEIMETQAGYIDVPEFEPGSTYMPFSNQLDFLGNAVPYWYYVSGNNVQKEQVPSKKDMEEDLSAFIEEQIVNCNLKDYSEQGYRIIMGEPKVKTSIQNDFVEVNLNMDLNLKGVEDTVIVGSHDIKVESKLGDLYGSAREIYDKEQEELFLENYAVDTLRTYAPVDGVEITCAPKVWVINEVFEELQKAIESNTLALKASSGDYDLQNKEDKYFIVDVGISQNVRFLNSRNWPYSYEVLPDDGDVLIGDPVGNQQGLGMMGFCYVPYHFIYNVKYPVLIQIEDDMERFQFPVAVVVQGNKPREPIASAEASNFELTDLCKYKNAPVIVNVYDNQLNVVDADISYECFGMQCFAGKTDSGILKTEFPQCVNGFVVAKAEGYETARYVYSSTDEGSVDVIMNKLYETNVDLKLNGMSYSKDAIINFVSEGNSKTVIYPGQRTVELSEGDYEIEVYIYDSSTLKLEAVNTQKCIEVPQSGIGGFFGLTKEECYDLEMPEQIISNALAGGGKQSYYILESELQNANSIGISAEKLPTPSTIEQLQDNYLLFESKKLGVDFI